MKTICAPDNVACLAHDLAQAGPLGLVLVLAVLAGAAFAFIATRF